MSAATTKVLIADDLESMRFELVSKLTTMGIVNIEEHADGKTAWDSIQEHDFDIFFLDINMPVMNGIQLLKKIRSLEKFRKTPILMVSTENEKEIIVQCILLGASDYILKPFDPALLREKMAKLLKI